MLKIKTKLKIAFLLISITIIQNNLYSRKEPTGNAEVVYESLVSIFKNFILVYGGTLSGTISHEFGHAIINKTLAGSDVSIHIGTNNPKKTEIFSLSSGKNKIAFHGLNPHIGVTSFNKLPEKKIGQFMSYTAGGVFGLASDYLFLSLIAAYHKYNECKNLKKSIIYGLKNAFFPHKNIKLNPNLNIIEQSIHALFVFYYMDYVVRRLIYSFLPSKYSNGDGTMAWKILGASDQTLKTMSIASVLLCYASFILFTAKLGCCLEDYKKPSE